MGSSDQSGNKAFVDFILHVMFGGLAFLLLFLVTVGTRAVVEMFQGTGYVSGDVATIMHFAEPCIFVLDVFLFALLSITEACKLIGKLWIWRRA